MRRVRETAKVLCGNYAAGQWRIAVQCKMIGTVTKVSIVTVAGSINDRITAIEKATEKALYPTLGQAGVSVLASCTASDAINEPQKEGAK